MSTTPLFPQQITNGVMIWAVVNGVIILALFLLWHFKSNRSKGATLANYGIIWGDTGSVKWRKVGKALLFGFLVVALTYALASICHWAFKVSPHFWVFTIKQFTVDGFITFLGYWLPFTFFFAAFSVLYHSELRSAASASNKLGVEMIKNFLIITIPILGVAALVTTFFYRKTGRIYPAAFINGTLMTWMIIASQATYVV